MHRKTCGVRRNGRLTGHTGQYELKGATLISVISVCLCPRVTGNCLRWRRWWRHWRLTAVSTSRYKYSATYWLMHLSVWGRGFLMRLRANHVGDRASHLALASAPAARVSLQSRSPQLPFATGCLHNQLPFFCVVLTGLMLRQVVDVRGKGNLDAEAMVFVSGRSGAHLRRMADVIVTAVSTPRLTQSPQSGTPVKPALHRPRVAGWATSP